MAAERLISLLRQLNAADCVSGEALAARLGISRASVQLALKHAEALGVTLERVPGHGYRLQHPADWLDASCWDLPPGWTGQVVPVIDSTNAELLRNRTWPHKTVLAAEWQTAGRGRQGRPWLGVPGGSLMFSLVWQFSQDVTRLGGLSLVVGLALAETLAEWGVPRLKLKWPNDVMVDYRKLAGILIEAQAEAGSPCRAIIGIGLNLRLPAVIRDDIDQAVVDLASLLAVVPERNRLLSALLGHLEQQLTAFEAEGFAGVRARWLSWHAYQGQAVRLRQPSGAEFCGTVTGVGDEGELCVLLSEGERRFSVGELSLRRGPV